MKLFSTRIQNFATEKCNTPLSIKVFDTRMFFKHRGLPLLIFPRSIETEVFDGSSWESLPLIHKSIAFGNFLKNRSVTLHVLRYCQTKKTQQKFMIPPLSPIHENCRHWNVSETQKAFPYELFGTQGQKFFNGNSGYNPPSIHRKIWYRIFSEKQNFLL